MDTEFYDNLTDAIKALRKQGYSEDFNLASDCVHCSDATLRLYPEEFDIDKVFRFFGPSDPDDESILYAISSKKLGLKGILINAFGINADPLTEEMVHKLTAT